MKRGENTAGVLTFHWDCFMVTVPTETIFEGQIRVLVTTTQFNSLHCRIILHPCPLKCRDCYVTWFVPKWKWKGAVCLGPLSFAVETPADLQTEVALSDHIPGQ